MHFRKYLLFSAIFLFLIFACTIARTFQFGFLTFFKGSVVNTPQKLRLFHAISWSSESPDHSFGVSLLAADTTKPYVQFDAIGGMPGIQSLFVEHSRPFYNEVDGVYLEILVVNDKGEPLCSIDWNKKNKLIKLRSVTRLSQSNESGVVCEPVFYCFGDASELAEELLRKIHYHYPIE